jgi:hypoxia up-regulated 1
MTLIGQEFTPELKSSARENDLIGNELAADDRGLVGFKLDTKNEELKEKIFTSEEILSMILEHGSKHAKKMDKSGAKDVAITIPSFYSIAQRQMVIDAAELAGLEVLTLVHENTAAALMYGIDTKDLKTPKTILFVNQGHHNFEVSIVRYNHTQGTSNSKKET